jgi:hypothetical protein
MAINPVSVPLVIAIEPESPGDTATLFRLRIDQRVVGGRLTAAQTHLLIGEILDRIALPNGATVIPFDASRRHPLAS